MNQPVISNFSPTSGVAGSSIVISGSNFSQVSRVEFGGTPATFTINSDTQITAIVPSGASSGRVTLSAPGIVSSSGYFQVGGSATQSSGGNATAANQHEQIAILEELRDAIAIPPLRDLFNLLNNAIINAEFSSAERLAVLGQVRENLRIIINQFGAIRLSSEGILVDSSATVQPVSATSLPLPNGAASENLLQRVFNELEAVSGYLNSLQELKLRLSQTVSLLDTIATKQSKFIYPTINHVVLQVANEEEGFTTPPTRKLVFQTLNGADLRYAYNFGYAKNSTLPYYLLKGGIEETEDWSPDFFAGTIYFASSTPNTTVLIKTYTEDT